MEGEQRMRRTLKLTGQSTNREAPATFDLPVGLYRVTASDGETIGIKVSQGPAGLTISIRTYFDNLSLEYDACATPRPRTREVHATYYSPGDQKALNFRDWYDRVAGASDPYAMNATA